MPRNFQTILRFLRRSMRDMGGNTSILFGLTLVPMLAFIGASIDYGRAIDARSALQSAVDAAALAAVDKFAGDSSALRRAADDIFAANLEATTVNITATPNISINGDTATVTASTSVTTVLMGLMDVDTIEVGVSATAVSAPEIGPVCVLALDRSADEAIGLDGTAELIAENCVVHANSRSDAALTAPGSTYGEADTFCAVGGHNGNGFTPKPVSHCSIALDPFADLEQPLTEGCDYPNKRFNRGNHAISPGIYCDGMTINSFAEVRMAPGVYIIKEGPLTMHANSSLVGTDVTIYLVGEGAVLDIKSYSNVDITAPSFGPYAGLAIVQDADSDFGETSSIEGGGLLRIVGAIYLPEQILTVGGEGSIGQDSPYMPIIAKQVKFHGNATIAINVDEDAEGYPDFLPTVRSGTPRLIN